MRLGTADVLVRAKTDKFDKDIDKSGKKVKSFGQKSKKELAGLTSSFASLAGAAGIGAATYALKSFIDLSNEQIAVETRMEAVLKSTGYAAGYNADQIKNMAASMQDVTTVGDEIIIAGQAILLTFKKVRGEAFERATAAALDMSEVMQTDLKSSIVMIGKAMNDPIANLSAMTRAGVQFTDSQKETIKELWKSGDAMGAQKIILKELESQFGGAAKAARNTFGGATKAAGNVLGDFKEEIGHAITKNEFFIESIHDLEKQFKNWIEYVQEHKDEIKQDFVDFAKSAKEIGGHLADIGKHVGSFLSNTLRGWNALPTIVQEMGIVGAVVGGVPGRLALIGTVEILGQAVGYIDELVKSAEGISTVFGKEFKLVEDLEGAEKQLAQLEKLRDEFLDLSAVGKKKMGGNVYLERLSEQIDDVEDHLDDLWEKIKKTGIPEKKVKPPKIKTPAKIDDSWIKSMQAQEKFALEMAEKEQKRLNAKYELEKEINAKIHDELLSDTEVRLQELDKQFLAADSSMKDKVVLDEWYVKQYEEIVGTQEQAYMDLYNNFGILTQEAYDQIYESYVKDRDDFIALTGDKETAHQVFTERLIALNAEMETGNKSWIDGAKAGLESYAETSGDVFSNIKDFAVNSLNRMEDAIVDFCMTGKFNFEDFAKAIIKDLIRIAVQAAITKAIMAGISGAFGGGADTSGADTSGAEVTYVAQGGVFDSPSLSKHSNTVVDSPTFFSFARGQGLMGEAGPEAIMPLTRLPGGDLGVKTESGKTAVPAITVNIHEAPGTQTRVEQSEDGQRLEVIIEQVEQAMTGRMERGSGMAPFMDGRYGRAY